MKLTCMNPSTDEILGEIEITKNKDVHQIVENAKKAYTSWSMQSVEHRLKYLKKAYCQFQEKKEDIAKLISAEMGMPIKESISDYENTLSYFKWYMDNAKAILSPQVTYEDETQVHTLFYESRGTACIIVSWNFPFLLFVWQAVPNLICGNTVVMKFSHHTAMCAKAIQQVLDECLPKDVFKQVYGPGSTANVLVHEDIDLLCFTGSTSVGKNLYKIAADKFIPSIMELGGSAAGIVCEDCVVDEVLDTIYNARFYNTGQVCDGLKRLLVAESRMEEVVEKLKDIVLTKKAGNAEDPTTDIGPIVSDEQVNTLKKQLDDAVEKGATIVCGGSFEGRIMQPTILTGVTKDMLVMKEEVFGPILPIMAFKTVNQAIMIANSLAYGLGGYVFTEDRETFSYIARRMQTGMIGCNNVSYNIPCNPFGGYKQSGVGRNNSDICFRELCNVKIVACPK